MVIDSFDLKLLSGLLFVMVVTLGFIYQELKEIKNKLPGEVFYYRITAALEKDDDDDDEDEELDMEGKPYAHG